MPLLWFGDSEHPSAPFQWHDVQWQQATSLALPAKSNGNTTAAYGLMPLRITPSQAGSWIGRRSEGSSVNCDDAQLCIHSGGTHTECAAHISDQSFGIADIAPLRLLRCVLLDVAPESTPAGFAVLRGSLQRAWEHVLSEPSKRPAPQAIIVRSRRPSEVPHRNWSGSQPPYFSPEAMEFLVEQGIEHLVTDLPSLDPEVDGGALRAHRAFFGLAPLHTARIHAATVTELAWIPESLRPGVGLLRLDVMAWNSDAAPSRPIFYPILGKD